MASLLRYWHTIRFLKPKQIYRRIWLRRIPVQVERGPAPPTRVSAADWVKPAARSARMLGPRDFRFLNRDGSCRSAADWNDASRHKLWLYNLHYFDDLTASGADGRVSWHAALVHRWIHENPPVRGVGWDPYPTSLRIVNWIKWAGLGAPVPADFQRSLATQARWLAKRIEHHLLANHIFANAKALIMAGLHFQGSEADRWRAQGLRLLGDELPIQVLADGGHCERSPMYHGIVLEDLLDLINACQAHPGIVPDETLSGWTHAAGLMRSWLTAMCHPDEQISFFNDSAIDGAASPPELRAYAGRLGLSAEVAGQLGESGYLRAVRGGAVLIADIAEIGPDYQPAHAHADTLSFELSLGKQRIVVNSGTSTYELGPQRAYERSTRAHNTVEINEIDSSEVWGAFRVARRARPFARRLAAGTDATVLEGAHDGYGRVPGRPIHHREWRLEDRCLRITDRIDGPFRSAVARLYFHPSIKLAEANTFWMADGTRLSWAVRGGMPRLLESEWYPEFGRVEPNLCLETALDGCELVVELSW